MFTIGLAIAALSFVLSGCPDARPTLATSVLAATVSVPTPPDNSDPANLVLNPSFEADTASPPGDWVKLSGKFQTFTGSGFNIAGFDGLARSIDSREARSSCFAINPSSDLIFTGLVLSPQSTPKTVVGFKIWYFTDAGCSSPASTATQTQTPFSLSAENSWELNDFSQPAAAVPNDATHAYVSLRAAYVNRVGSRTDQAYFDNIVVTSAPPTQPSTYTVGGTVGGLAGTLVLQNNGADDLSLSSNGSFTFATALTEGTSYGVTVASQPPGQTCTVSNGSGMVGSADVTTVAVSCVTNTYTVGGSISGLTGSLVLRNNGGDDLATSANGGFVFATAVTDGSSYDVTVATQPAGQTCTVTNGSGTVAGANVSNVSVVCVTDTVSYTVGGTISGLTGSLVLRNNGGDDLATSANGGFVFATAVSDGGAYMVTVAIQPAGQTCTVSNGSGLVAGADVSNVSVDCVTNTYTVGGTISGLTGGLTLRNNGGDDLVTSSNGGFVFATAVTDGSAYNVTVVNQPAGQTCTVTNGSGTVSGANVSNVSVVCVTDTVSYTVGGTISGLTGSLVLRNNGGDDLATSSNGGFVFATAVPDGGAYNVTVASQPSGQTCTVAGGSGTVAGANVSSVSVSCATNTFTVGGTVSGLTGSVVLRNNGGDDYATSSNGGFVFPTALTDTSAYDVTVATQPSGQTCTVSNGSGTVAGANVSNVSVSCVINTYTVGGTIAGLTGTLTLQNNGGDDLVSQADGTFAFAAALPDGAGYAVTVSGQPAGQTCTVTNGTGTVAGANVTDVAVACVTTNPGDGVILATSFEPGEPDFEKVAGAGTFSPDTCPAGTVPRTGSAGISNTTITTSYAGRSIQTVGCLATVATPIQASFWGTASTGNGGNQIYARANFLWFTDASCTTAHGTATTAGSSVILPEGSYVQVSATASRPDASATHFKVRAEMRDDNGGTNTDDDWCIDDVRIGAGSYTVGGFVSGASGNVVLQNNGGDDLIVTANGSFVFATSLADGASYDVSVLTHPTGQTCTVTGGSGAVSGGNVTSVSVNCLDDGVAAPISIRVGSWNIQNFGDTKVAQTSVMDVISLTALRYDVLFLQEMKVAEDGACAPMASGASCALLDRINAADRAGTGAYALVSSATAGDGTGYAEKYVVLYKRSTISTVSDLGLATVGTWTREPHIVRVTVGNEDFYVVNIHTTPTLATEQIYDLPLVANLLEPSDADIVILGDFNADGAYFNEATGWPTYFGAFNTPGYQHLIDNAVNTTVGVTENTYDRITASPTLVAVTQAGSSRAYYFDGPGCPAGEMDGIIAEGCGSWLTDCTCMGAAASVSDHYPVETVLNLGGGGAGFYSVGGGISGLVGSVTLQNNGADDMVLSGNGFFVFPTALTDGSAYEVTVSAQPAGYTCTVANPSGTVSGANVTSVSVSCVPDVTEPVVVINEIQCGKSSAPEDFIELYVVQGGSLGGWTIKKWASGASPSPEYTFAAGFTVATGDHVVLHYDAVNQGAFAQEDTAAIDSSNGTDNSPSAWDVYIATTSLTCTDNVALLENSAGAIVDVVPFSNRDGVITSTMRGVFSSIYADPTYLWTFSAPADGTNDALIQAEAALVGTSTSAQRDSSPFSDTDSVSGWCVATPTMGAVNVDCP